MGNHQRGGPPGRGPLGPGRPPQHQGPPGRGPGGPGRPSHGGGGGGREDRSGGSQAIWPPARVRGILANQVVHPSYRLDVFCEMGEAQEKFAPLPSKEAVYRRTIEVVRARSDLAKHWRARRQSWLGPLEAKGLAKTLVVEAQSRVVLWLSSPSATELGFCLHHVYGIPFLPPSGLKGLASMALWREVDPGFTRSSPARGKNPPCPPTEVLDLFGEGGDKGHEGRVAFLDGIPMGNEAGEVCLDLDVMTPHHPDYYGERLKHPHDCEGPNPLLFLCIPPGQRFEVGLVFTRESSSMGRGASHWLGEAQKWLLKGLGEMGLGAKTTSGYGRLGPPGAASHAVSSGISTAFQPGLRRVVATVVKTDRKSAQGVAQDEAGREFAFSCALLSSKLQVYPQQWATLHGSRLVFIFDGDKVVSLEREGGS